MGGSLQSQALVGSRRFSWLRELGQGSQVRCDKHDSTCTDCNEAHEVGPSVVETSQPDRGLAGGFLFIVANGTKDWSVDREKKYVRL